ncbi:GLPGLI family protein [Cellulophaga fucicola]|uniref:GLPGLI family protein n=1 Tax=Cellulophaga fucicola TaxID=76595 RepID=UPI003EB89829
MKIIYILLLIPILGFTQTQGGTIIYSSNMDIRKNEHINNKNVEKSQFNEYRVNMFDAAKNLEFKVTFNKKIGLFENIDKLYAGNGMFEELALISSLYKGKVYTSIPLNKQIIQTKKGINIDAQIEKQDWKLTKESKKIGGFLCYKATLVKTVPIGDVTLVAWYTPEIPFAYGPNGYANQLPGLILELDDLMISYTAKEIKLNPKKPVDIKWPQNIKTMSKDEYKKAGDEYYNKLKKEKR